MQHIHSHNRKICKTQIQDIKGVGLMRAIFIHSACQKYSLTNVVSKISICFLNIVLVYYIFTWLNYRFLNVFRPIKINRFHVMIKRVFPRFIHCIKSTASLGLSKNILNEGWKFLFHVLYFLFILIAYLWVILSDFKSNF